MSTGTAYWTCSRCVKVFPSAIGDRVLDPFSIVLGNKQKCPHCGHENVLSNLVNAPPLGMKHTEWIQREYLSLTVPHEFERAVQAYKANADRAVSLPFLQWWLIQSVEEFVRMVDAIEKEIEAELPATEEIVKRRELALRVGKRLADREITDKRFVDVTPELDQLLRWRATDGAVLGAYSMLSAIAIGAWTAFEALSGDLWEDALNSYPLLGARALNAEPEPDESEGDADERIRKKKFPIPVWMLENHDYNLKNCLGTIFRSQKRWDFANRIKAAEAYRKVFCIARDDTRRATLSRIFDDLKLRWLAALRHALVHHGGRATTEFLRQTKAHKSFPKTPKDAQIHLDGVIVSELVENSIQCGMRLIRFVVHEAQALPARKTGPVSPSG
jgi:hypothetical protein